MAKGLTLADGRTTLVDDDVLVWASGYHWHRTGTIRDGYVGRCRPIRKGNIFLHREILNAPDDFEVDHINGDKLDNRRENLRLVTHAQNQQNYQGARAGSGTGIRGVQWHRHKQRYMARLKVNGRTISLGYFKSLEDAAVAAAAGRARYFTHSAECVDGAS